jgi:mono/diheme cytochrome c family protein
MSTEITPSSESGHRGKFGTPPFWMVSTCLIVVVASWLPLVFFARARTVTTTEPRVQFMQDMGSQMKYKEQQTNALFNDGRADRPMIPGTVARGHLDNDDHYYRGFTWVTDAKTGKRAPKFYDTFPKQVKIDPALLARGRQRFIIYCAPCHGWDGSGHGPVNERAVEVAQHDSGTKWIPAADLHSDAVRARPVGHLFNTITHGIRSMPPYAAQVPVADRWAIVAYVRALQLSGHAPASALPKSELEELP